MNMVRGAADGAGRATQLEAFRLDGAVDSLFEVDRDQGPPSLGPPDQMRKHLEPASHPSPPAPQPMGSFLPRRSDTPPRPNASAPTQPTRPKQPRKRLIFPRPRLQPGSPVGVSVVVSIGAPAAVPNPALAWRRPRTSEGAQRRSATKHFAGRPARTLCVRLSRRVR